jgi:uncharacterized delta-60 repeat protein
MINASTLRQYLCGWMVFMALSPALAGTFTDVNPAGWSAPYIEAIAAAGITNGCGNGNYCPSQSVNREQMAVLIVRALEGTPPADTCTGGSGFADVAVGAWSCAYIKRMGQLGVTTGCGGGNYCPGQLVNREQMAVFIVRALEGTPPADTCTGGSGFADVSANAWSCAHIKRMQQLGITTGCGGGNYCPAQVVTREQMAAFLVRAFLAGGKLDTTFASAGFTVHDNAAGGGGNDLGHAITIDGSGRILVTGYSLNANGALVMALWRYTEAGVLDTTFNGSGFVTHAGGGGLSAADEAIGAGVAVDANGHIVVAGYSVEGNTWGTMIWRFNADGTLDTTFGNAGIARYASPQSGGARMAVDASGRIIVAGFSWSGTDWDTSVWRYTASGELDTSFNGTGVYTINASAGTGATGEDIATGVTIDASGRVVVVGYSTNAAGDQDMTVWRFTDDGTPDASFGSAGVFRHDNAAGGHGNDVAQSVKVDASGRIVATGWSPRIAGNLNEDLAVWRLLPNGTLDTSFNGTGYLTHSGAAGGDGMDIGRGIGIDGTGRIVVVGQSQNAAGDSDMVVWRYTEAGQLDAMFGSGGVKVQAGTAGGTAGRDGARAIAFDSNGRLLVAGHSVNAAGNSDMVLWRLLP